MDIAMLVSEIREQLAALEVSAHIEIRLARPGSGPGGRGRGEALPEALDPGDIAEIHLSEVVVTSLPLKLPLIVPEPLLAGFRDRLGSALNRSLAAEPLWLARSTLVDIRVGRRRYRKELEIRCEYSVVGATVDTCSRHGWEARAARFHAIVLPDLDTEFHMVEVLPAMS